MTKHGKTEKVSQWQDERGEDGVVVLPEGGKKKVLIGARMVSTKEKRTKLDEDAKEAQDEIFDKASKGLEVEGQDQDRIHVFMFPLLFALSAWHTTMGS